MRYLAVLFGVLMLPCRAIAQETDPLEPYSGGPIVMTTVGLDPGTDAVTTAPAADPAATPAGGDAEDGTAPSAPAVTSTTPLPSSIDDTSSPGVASAPGPSVTSGSEGEAVRASATTLAVAPSAAGPEGGGTILWILAGALALITIAAAVGIGRRRRALSRTTTG